MVTKAVHLGINDHAKSIHEDNLDGFNIKIKSSKQGFKTLIKPSSKSIKTHYRKLADIFDKHKNTSAKALIAKLNPVIRRVAHYYSTVVSKRAKNLALFQFGKNPVSLNWY